MATIKPVSIKPTGMKVEVPDGQVLIATLNADGEETGYFYYPSHKYRKYYADTTKFKVIQEGESIKLISNYESIVRTGAKISKRITGGCRTCG